MPNPVTAESRHALSRAKLFLDKAAECRGDERVDFEAYLEAAIVFARASLHRLQTQFRKHPDWKTWWESLSSDAAVTFFRVQRDFILKEAAPKVGQKVFGAPAISRWSVGGQPSPVGSDSPPAYQPSHALECYSLRIPARRLRQQ